VIVDNFLIFILLMLLMNIPTQVSPANISHISDTYITILCQLTSLHHYAFIFHTKR